MSVVTDYPDWSPHVAAAQQIAATGVPLLAKPSVIYHLTGVTVPGGSSVTEPTKVIGQIGYSLLVTTSYAAGATVPFVTVLVQWIDSVLGAVVATDTFTVPGATSPGFIEVMGRGPTKADQVNITLTNNDPSVTATVGLFMVQDSYVRSRDDWRLANSLLGIVTVPGFTLPSFSGDESVLGMLGGVSIPASSSTTFLFGMYAGPITVGLDQDIALWTNVRLKIAAAPLSVYVPDNPIYAAASPPPVIQIAGPRAPLRVIITNTATTPFTAAMSLIAAD